MKKRDSGQVVSPTNHFAFTPMLPGAAVGTVEYRSMTESVRRSNPLVEYVEARAVDVDPAGQRVEVELAPLVSFRGDQRVKAEKKRSWIPYDRLVVACGVRVNDEIVPGAAEHCYRLKECDDAVKLRRAVGSRFETAARMIGKDGLDKERRRQLLTFVVVGGGPTGVELAGELSDYLRDVCRNFPKLDPSEPRIVLIHAGQELLQQFEPPQRKECLRVMDELGVEVELGTRVDRVDADHLTLRRPKGDKGEKVEDLPYGVAVWCAGTAPQPFMETFLSRLPAAAAAGRFVAVDDWLRVRLDYDDDDKKGHGEKIARGSILALGDCARMASKETDLLPQTAQVAAQQGAYAARFLNRNYDASTPPLARDDLYDDRFFEKFYLYEIRKARVAPTFNFLNLGILAYLGAGKALAEVKFGDNVPLGAYIGSAGYLLWKSVYLTKQVATRNRVLVTFDWLKAALFGRDITRL
mmetsp:Transcript_14438/g.47105  ORF Transcript_14438/g.47105 Transcript_14438/m.47105 type:complete len:467 (+) Transcript_14438:209-1609(+)